MAPSFSLPLLVSFLLHFILAANAQEGLAMGFYMKTCPNFEAIVQRKISYWLGRDRTIGPGLIRLHFHDCAVRGCDASILLYGSGSERSAKASASLRGFEIINEIKTELEKQCPKTVSCADILTAAARDATFKIGGPFWENFYGRRDGRVSIANEVSSVPKGRESMTELIELFQSKGMSLLDLVVLSGAHTIGRCTCDTIQFRLYNYNGAKGHSDPTLNPYYANYLKRKCYSPSKLVDLDAITPISFDLQYYKNLQKKMGLLQTDQLLLSDSRTSPIVSALASQPMLFFQQFAVSMINLGNTQVLTGGEGEIRTNCNFVNKR